MWLAWLALSLAMVAYLYGWAGAQGFQKINGRHSLAVYLLFMPYRLGAKINSWAWTQKYPSSNLIVEGVYLGRLPSGKEFNKAGCQFLLDLAVEFPSPKGVENVIQLSWLDLVKPTTDELLHAAQEIETLRKRGNLLVSCALGVSRSAAAITAWLHWSGRASTMAEAVDLIYKKRPQIVLKDDWLPIFSEFELLCQKEHGE